MVVGVVVAGAFLGVNNTVITQAVMGAAPVERPVASAAYSFVRFSGGAVAPWLAGRLGEDVSIHAPFWMGAAAVTVSILILASGRRFLVVVPPAPQSVEEAELVATADLD
jgi:MFS family permease